jgi:hypothetical protein
MKCVRWWILSPSVDFSKQTSRQQAAGSPSTGTASWLSLEGAVGLQCTCFASSVLFSRRCFLRLWVISTSTPKQNDRRPGPSPVKAERQYGRGRGGSCGSRSKESEASVPDAGPASSSSPARGLACAGRLRRPAGVGSGSRQG